VLFKPAVQTRLMVWDASGQPNGIYILQTKNGELSIQQKINLIR
jgi:hypothetical protein